MPVKKIILLFISVFALSASIPIQVENEYPLKAAFLYRFIDYIEWSDNNNEPFFNIAVLGDSPILAPLNQIAGSKLAKNKRISVKQYDNLNTIGSPQILFISRSSGYTIEEILSKISGKPMLIVTEQPGYAEKGAHLNFFASESKLRFEVNLKSANRFGLKFSYQLLQHAVVVN